MSIGKEDDKDSTASPSKAGIFAPGHKQPLRLDPELSKPLDENQLEDFLNQHGLSMKP
jgi:hypothetical protein